MALCERYTNSSTWKSIVHQKFLIIWLIHDNFILFIFECVLTCDTIEFIWMYVRAGTLVSRAYLMKWHNMMENEITFSVCM